MKIVVISDTHIPAAADGIHEKIREQIKDCDCIVHAGDATEMYVIEELRHFAETYAVCGNMDSPEVKKALSEKLIFEADGKTIGIVHGHGAFSDAVEAAKKAFKGKQPDVVIFGHSHLPFSEVIDNTLFFNPGSVSDRMFAPYRSFGMISITDGAIEAEIIKLN